MGFLFKKKEVPAELPSLAIEEINKNIASASLNISSDQTKIKQDLNLNSQNQASPSSQSAQNSNSTSSTSASSSQNAAQNSINQPFYEEQGYFKELIKSVTEEKQDASKLDSWYKNKFAPGDMVFQMREYWQKQQPELLLKNVSGELKNKLLDQTGKLHNLEKEWQQIYFNLIAKEEDIRKEEKELKDSLSEFISLYKNSLSKESLSGSKTKNKK